MKKIFTQEEALKKMRSGKNIFLTGMPGTGKSYITKQFIQEQESEGKQVLVCAPTGIAAQNLNGVTMHQAFTIPIPAYGHYITEITNSKVKAALTADIIIIDEISMCRNDVFEYFGYVIDYVNKEGRKPQIIVVGDMFQLPPVVPEAEVAKLKRYGFDASGYCFTSRYWKKFKFVPIVLSKIIRQEDEQFINNLGLLRIGDISCMDYFNERVFDASKYENDDTHIIQICSTNAAAQEINDKQLAVLNAPMCLYKMKKEKFCPKETVAEENLILKEGARVMFIANDVIDKAFMNGETGTVTLCLDNYVRVKKDNGEEINVWPYKWRVYNLKTSGGAISKSEVGNYTQLPLKLAYCVTMHKTQGQTYDKAVITPASFTFGQLYVALSRVRTIEGIYLTQSIEARDIKANPLIVQFYETFDFEVTASLIEKRKKLDKAAETRKKKKSTKRKTTPKKQTPKTTKISNSKTTKAKSTTTVKTKKSTNKKSTQKKTTKTQTTSAKKKAARKTGKKA